MSKLKGILEFIKERIFGFLNCFKMRPLSCVGLLIFESLLLYGINVAITPFDNNYKTQISESITTNAKASEFGLSLNSVQMRSRGSSDFYIYSDNELQDFQMRNQHYEGVKDYVFAAYEPYDNYYPFAFSAYDDAQIQCSTLSFESKYTGTDFYFDLPLLHGTFPGSIEKSSVVITDIIAEKILGAGGNYASLIGQKLIGSSKTPAGSGFQTYNIAAIVGTDNNLGRFMSTVFGDNMVFLPEYNLFQMRGYCYFLGSTNKNENSLMIDFVLDKFKTTKTTSRHLESGYVATYMFYDYDSASSTYVLSKTNDFLNKILDFYNGVLPTIFLAFGAVFTVLFFALTTIFVLGEKKYFYSNGVAACLFVNWAILGFAFLMNSLMYAFFPVVTIFTGQRIAVASTTISTVLFLAWITISGYIAALCLVRKR